MKRALYTALFLLASLFLWNTTVQAADFSFGFMIRAGRPAAADWELQIGASSGDLSTPKFEIFTPATFGTNHFGNDTPHRFEVGYRAASNQAYVRVHTTSSASSPFVEATYNNPGATLSSPSTWTLPANGLYVAASGNAAGAAKPTTGIRVENLAWGSGGSGPSLANLAVAHTGAAPTAFSGVAPTVFLSGSTGDWVLTGNFRFQGLSTYVTDGARGSQLQFGFNVSGTDAAVPEPSTYLLMASALGALAFFRHRTANS